VTPFIDWLTATPLSDAIKVHAWAVPVIQTVHILAIAVLMGTVLIVDLRLVGLGGRSQRIGHVARRYLPWFWAAFAVLAVTGALMVIGEPSRELLNPSFWLKMKLLIVALVVTGTFSLLVWNRADHLDDNPRARRIAALLAVGMLLVFVAIIFAGRFIAYTIEN